RNFFLGSSALAQLIELVHLDDDDEVDDGGDDEEVDGRGDDRTQIDRRLFDVLLDLEGQCRTLGTTDSGDERMDDLVGECGDDGGEGAADDDRRSEFDDIPLKNEVSETLKHQRKPLGVYVH